MTRLTESVYSYPINNSIGKRWHSCTGKLPVPLTNDFLFRALLQSDNTTLVHLVAALLGRKLTEVHSATITNPIFLGDSIDDKYFVMDVRVQLNNDANLNLEMQVCNEHNWTDRSLGYLCRLYDNLNRGDAYESTKAAIQFSFLDFTLFEEHPEFFASYKLLNTRSLYPYTDKFELYVIDLTKISLATEIDKKYKIDQWARMFKAKTWEDLKMIAKRNQEIDTAISGIYQMTEDEIIREQCRQRDEFLLRQEMERRRLERTNEKLKTAEMALENINTELKNKDARLKDMDVQLKDKDAELKDKDAELKDKDDQLKSAQGELSAKEKTIQELEQKLRELGALS